MAPESIGLTDMEPPLVAFGDEIGAGADAATDDVVIDVDKLGGNGGSVNKPGGDGIDGAGGTVDADIVEVGFKMVVAVDDDGVTADIELVAGLAHGKEFVVSVDEVNAGLGGRVGESVRDAAGLGAVVGHASEPPGEQTRFVWSHPQPNDAMPRPLHRLQSVMLPQPPLGNWQLRKRSASKRRTQTTSLSLV